MSILVLIVLGIFLISTCGGCENSNECPKDNYNEIVNELTNSCFYLNDLTFSKNESEISLSISYLDNTEKEVDFIAFGIVWLDKWGEPTINYKDYAKNSILKWNNPLKYDTGKWINVAKGENIKGFYVPLIEIHYKDGTTKTLHNYDIGGNNKYYTSI